MNQERRLHDSAQLFAQQYGAFYVVVQTRPTPGAAGAVWFILFTLFPLDILESSDVQNGFSMSDNQDKSFSRVLKPFKFEECELYLVFPCQPIRARALVDYLTVAFCKNDILS